jgi:succinate-semialdehyde dehydrogenase/glutarate-semialdehyde dehydrogenase
MQNAGQSCIAAKRFIVLESVKDDFTDRFQKSIAALKQGNPFHGQTTTGPLARPDLAEDLIRQLEASVKKGARLLTGGTNAGANFQPALLDNVTPGMAAFDEETFGPLAAVITAKTEEEAIALANNSRYGLGASIWTKDLEKGERLAREIESGSVFINALMKSDARLPFGGVKKSGYGRELSELGIHEFVNAKSISIA